MHHVIIGYGYTGFHLAKYLISKQKTITAISRHLDETQNVPGVEYVQHDIQTPFLWTRQNAIVYYLIPPPSTGKQDTLLQTFLKTSNIKPAKLIYFGSSAVYGDQSGSWVDENTSCQVTFDRQFRRLDAENQCQEFAMEKAIDCVLLRIGGIYGPNRLPIDAAIKQSALITPESAPDTNVIYVKDLAQIAALLAITPDAKGIYNISDGLPEPMGTLQQQVATCLGLPPAPFHGFEQVWAEASAMKREFMHASKRLSIKTLEMTLGKSLVFTPKMTAINESLREEGKLL